MKNLWWLAIVLILAGCASGPKLASGYQNLPLVLSASAPHGDITLYATSATTVEGVTPYGTAEVSVVRGVISGNSDGIQINGVYKNGHALGEAVDGNFDIRISGRMVTASVPCCSVGLSSKRSSLIGYVGANNVTIILGPGFSITSPEVIAALVVALPEWQTGR